MLVVAKRLEGNGLRTKAVGALTVIPKVGGGGGGNIPFKPESAKQPQNSTNRIERLKRWRRHETVGLLVLGVSESVVRGGHTKHDSKRRSAEGQLLKELWGSESALISTGTSLQQ